MLHKTRSDIVLYFSISLRMSSQSNNVGVPESGQVATPTVAQVATPTAIAQASMVDSKTVANQVQEIQVIIHEIHAEGMVSGENFQVTVIIDKLPLAWKDFKNYLKHKRKEMSMEGLVVRLRIEEDNRRSDKQGPYFTKSEGKLCGTWSKFQEQAAQQREGL